MRSHTGRQRYCALFSWLDRTKIKLMLSYPMTTGRNFDEVLRVLIQSANRWPLLPR